ncbi:MAG: SpoIIE family protein phosphatase [Bryobacteraceae bacterium]
MASSTHGVVQKRTASLVVITPSGTRTRVALERLPFSIGRHPDSNLVLRDSRASRNHARITLDDGQYFIEDLKSSHGIFVNGARALRHSLQNGDQIEFGVPDSYSLIFTQGEGEIQKILEQFSTPQLVPGGAGNLAKLRSLVEVARALQNSLSTDEVLAAVLDAALAFTGFERGFLLLNRKDGLAIGVARDRTGNPLSQSDLQVPVDAIQRALQERRELLSMNFDPQDEGLGLDSAEEPRTVVCVPLVNVRTGSTDETRVITAASDTLGLIYLDSRQTAVDLSSGNRELLQTLALEASTIIENARLLDEERVKRRMEEELNIAREIQTSLLPEKLPSEGWFRVAGSSLASRQVGGDYFDVKQIGETCWSAEVTDVSGKGVSSALLAALLQGAFLHTSESALDIAQMMARVNRFLNERTEGEKYATVFYCTLDHTGVLNWVNAGHSRPFLVQQDGEITMLETTGMPLGLLEMATYTVQQQQLAPGDKIVAYSDGLSEAQNTEGKFFESARMRDIVRAHARSSCVELHNALMQEVALFIQGAEQSDDMTAVVIEYRPS